MFFAGRIEQYFEKYLTILSLLIIGGFDTGGEITHPLNHQHIYGT